MKYAGIIKNDITAGKGVCVSVFLQGCPHHCPGCHNPETWSFSGGEPFTEETMKEIIESISMNGIQRNLSILGGEPLCPRNLSLTEKIIDTVRENYPQIKIYVWSGYYLRELVNRDEITDRILKKIDILVDGPFIQKLRDVTLPMRGSSNQSIIDMKNLKKVENVI